jgi:hypothetical protein
MLPRRLNADGGPAQMPTEILLASKRQPPVNVRNEFFSREIIVCVSCNMSRLMDDPDGYSVDTFACWKNIALLTMPGIALLIVTSD